MTTSNFSSGLLNPEDYGLPSSGEIARIAAGYFPEFGGAEALAYSPSLAQEGSEDSNTSSRSVIESIANVGPDSQSAYKGTAYENSKYIGNFSLAQIRADFPILSEKVNGGKDLVWLDNAATTQRPQQVIDRITYYYQHENSNVHRAAHELAARSTDAYEGAREKIAKYLGAKSEKNIVFTRGTTEGINLVAHSFVKPLLSPGDEIVLSILEHHANIVPWQIIAQETGAIIRVAPVDEDGQLILSEFTKLFNSKTKFASVAHVSNALGTVTPASELVAIAHGFGVPILIDGAQSISHMPVNVSALDADFFVFSGHKIFGPTGIGAVYGKDEVLEAAKPYQGGGNMIADVTFEKTIYHKAPTKFEAGTGNIADAVGLGAAIDYVSKIGIQNIAAYEHELLEYATGELLKISGLHLVGTAANKASVLSFVLDGHSVPEVGQHLSNAGIAVRAGHHCAQPILRNFGLEATVRPSLAFYNTPAEIDLLAATIKSISK
ncbi:MAG: cysteine desulfurase [Clostridiales Family XIII bacterium]|jgi:cysteine desulfurase/selenocysteine lyase|nr:cysteine desulfurase [Clostridiales Family XIII bacterium]